MYENFVQHPSSPNIWVKDLSILEPPFDPYRNEIRLDNTKLSTYDECPRKFLLAYIKNIQSKNGSTSLRYGSTWHGAMEGFYETLKGLGWTQRAKAIEAAIINADKVWRRETGNLVFYNDYRTLENCINMFLAYVSYFAYDEGILDVINTEQVFACPIELKTLDEKRLFGHLPPIVFTGKIDLQALLNGVKWFIEFKTTGFNLDSQVQRLNRAAQVMGYTYAAPIVLGFRPEGALVSFAYSYSRKNKEGVYGKVTHDFTRSPQVFAPQDLDNWKRMFLTGCSEIYKKWQDRNFEQRLYSCYNYNRACQYTRICEGNRDVVDMPTSQILEYYPDFMYRVWDVETDGTDEAV